MRKFPEFTIDYENEWNDVERKHWICWTIRYEDNPYLTMRFYIDIFRRRGMKGDAPCLNFPHGHTLPFMWWIEYVIREQLAKMLNLKQYDEGIGDCENEYTDYQTYEEYFKAQNQFCQNDKTIEFRYNLEAEVLFQRMPEALHKYIGNPPRKIKTELKDSKYLFTMEE